MTDAFAFDELRAALGLSTPIALAILALVLLVAIQTLRLFFLRRRARVRLAGHVALGARGEARARGILRAAGYRLADEQARGSYELSVDGLPKKIHLRADFLVERGGRRFVAEVKSGAENASITGRATRRQLLEYSIAFDVDGVLLVGVRDGTIVEVRFPSVSIR